MTTTRITAPHVQKALDEHLQKHELKIDPKLHDVYHAVLGEQGKGGLCDEVDELKGVKTTVNRHDTLLVGEKGDNGLVSTAKDHETRLKSLEKVGDKVSGLTWSILAWALIQFLTSLPKLIALLNAD